MTNDMIFRALLLAWLSCLLVACDVATVKLVPSAIAKNECDRDSDCAGGSCVNEQCISRSGTFRTIFFEVTPPSGASLSAGLPFRKTIENVPAEGGELPLDLGLISQVTGRVTLAARKQACTPTFDVDGIDLAKGAQDTIPATVSLTPSARTLGVYSAPTVAQAALVGDSYFAFLVNVSPGDYDIYVQPGHQAKDTCVVPPQLLRAQPIRDGAFSLELKLSEPSKFELRVNWPRGDGALNGWLVDIVDPTSGRVISNQAPLVGGKTDFAATVFYLPVVGDTDEQKAQELVRLSPPEGVTAPSVLLARSALGLFDADRGTLSQFTSLPTPVHVQGQVTALATPKPVAATVAIVATKINGIEPGVLASFVRTLNVGKDGLFDLDLLPGSYRVSAIPSVELDVDPSGNADSKLSEATTAWLVPDSPAQQAGKVIELQQALPVNGQVFDVSGSAPAGSALVQALASSATVKADVLQQALGEGRLVPRAATTSVTGSGDFALIADSGTFDVSVRPLASTGFSWLVVPGVQVGTTPEQINGVNLGVLTLPPPVRYRGTVTLPGIDANSRNSVPGALVRSYVFTKANAYVSKPGDADSLVQVAEARADSTGRFELLIPAMLNGAAPQ